MRGHAENIINTGGDCEQTNFLKGSNKRRKLFFAFSACANVFIKAIHMSDSKATCLSSNWNKKKPGLRHGLKSKFLRLVGKILIGKFPSQIVLKKLGV